VVDAFLAAARDGNFQALLALLDPEVVVRADEVAARLGAWADVRGATAVAEHFTGVRGARPALIDGVAGAAWAPGGHARVAFSFTIRRGKVVAIDLRADPAYLRRVRMVKPNDVDSAQQ
jgi:RNA polymerase sigma-70 factor (ECF subfamily)